MGFTGNDAHDPRISIITKLVDQTLNNDATLQNDDEIFFPVIANHRYSFMFFIHYESSAVADLRSSFVAPVGTAPDGFAEVAQNGAALADFGAVSFQNGTTSPLGVILFGFIETGANAGNLQYQWAQGAAEVSNTTVHAGTTLMVYDQGPI